MPGMCSVPGCRGYRKARSRGVVFHSLPTRDPQRCRSWLKAIQSPKFNENTPVSKYGNIRVCSQHFTAEDYEPDIQAELMKTTPRKILKSHVIPTVFIGRQHEELSSPGPPGNSSRTQTSSSSSSSSSSQHHPPAELSGSLCMVASVDHLNELISSKETSKSDEKGEKEPSHSKTMVNDGCLMELFQRCQTCGRPITKRKVSHCGAQKKVRWRCVGGHGGVWTSSPLLWEKFPEIHLLSSLSILFSGGNFTHFKKWAKHLQLNFMGHKTFCEIQKAYLNPERIQEEHQQTGDTLLHKSGDGCLDSSLSGTRNKSQVEEKRDESSVITVQVRQHEQEKLNVFTGNGNY
ncbi:uncharacterized protein LOC131988095 [Centropristis striata]|uniref:uncharacterized protein LOC131988095 n=1 Tax=Centropristis striata TaxID=184440 RepID=UPI0027E1D9E0|nr:uncharacterized protein LOC131988095 [Centropristis striata]